MIAFLTSSPTREISEDRPTPALDERNGLVIELGKVWRPNSRCLMVAAFPDAYDLNDEMTDFYRQAVVHSGLSVSCFDLWDNRLCPPSKEELHRYDVIFLAGGHVPTENVWFRKIQLWALLKGYDGVVVGTSAGSMNSAEVVYVWPEEEGESFLPEDELFIPGLGLGKSIVLPHYQKLKDSWLDGRRLMEDITCSHSYGRRFFAIPDGSYVLVKDGLETVYGEAWLIADSQISSFSREGETRICWPIETDCR